MTSLCGLALFKCCSPPSFPSPTQASAGEDGYLRLWSIGEGRIAHELFIMPAVRGGADA